MYESAEEYVKGTLKERYIVTKYFNKNLRENCKRRNIPFFTIFYHMCSFNGKKIDFKDEYFSEIRNKKGHTTGMHLSKLLFPFFDIHIRDIEENYDRNFK